MRHVHTAPRSDSSNANETVYNLDPEQTRQLILGAPGSVVTLWISEANFEHGQTQLLAVVLERSAVTVNAQM